MRKLEPLFWGPVTLAGASCKTDEVTNLSQDVDVIVTGRNEKPGSRTHTLANPHLEAGNTPGRYSQGHQLPSPYQEPQVVTDIAFSLPETALHGPSGPQNSAPSHPPRSEPPC